MAERHTSAAVVSLGDELALGQSIDTNSAWIADRLLGMGIVTVEHVTVGDDAAATTRTLKRLAGEVDVVITTGGLGPTADDLTREALAEAMGEPLEEDAAALARIEKWFARASRAMPERNRTQALRPRGAAMLSNDHGTAPGIAARVERTDVFCLPGPPREMRPMFEGQVVSRLRPPGVSIRTRMLHTFGLGESDVAGRLAELMDRSRNPLVGTTASQAVVTCRVRWEGDAKAGERAIEDVEGVIRERLGAYVFGADGETLPGVVIELLAARRETIAVVESCTGGLLGAYLSETPGSSRAFAGGWITYTNELKERMVGVPREVLDKHGAVSRECAAAMARGGLERSGATHCLAVTGIAGPDGASEAKPVGTVWIARASGEEVEARRFAFFGGRENVRDWSVKSAVGMLRLKVVGEEGVRLLREGE